MSVNVARATALMRAEGVDGIVSATLENNFYLSGVWDDGQELFPLDSEFYTVATADAPDAGIVVCSIGAADLTLGGYPSLKDVVTFGTFFRDIVDGVSLDPDEQRVRAITEAHEVGRASVDALAEAITRLGLAEGVVAVDERGPKRDLLAALAEKLPKAQFRPASGLLRNIRAVKMPDEIERITEALRITENGLRAAFAEFREGVSEKDVQNAFERAVTAEGGRTGFCLVRFGKGLALGQVPASPDIKLGANDFAFFDVGIKYRGYRSDIGRLVSFGEPSDELRFLFDASKTGQQTAIDMMRPGVVAKDVFTAAVQAVRDAGIPSYKRQHVGHGIGIEYYDLPVLTPNAETVLEPGMVFEVETPYYRLGVGGSFIEDTVVVTDSGSSIITTLSRDLTVL
ncbi:Xaa-Pro peptidase family protein [Phytohabitans sp. ZYX-F-186]|uniref:Xaa-Pro peptidase family protein n=1 Tax=Phytohabitans maris TaxID=3071409 RepID=A0ABU0ZGA6_9ACTN|nr:Xaa-Pro peptidase family protein [Phytohabitans sp. ZYX-F-186]MDQ7906086.1 Xaa-Pro peptidase family protein [Phytohabitans sp. ZYX-F-186]